MLKIRFAALAAGCAVAMAGLAATAGGTPVDEYLDQQSSGAGVCAAALPAFEGLIRKRPLALQNEGTANAFVTCVPPQFKALAGDPVAGLGLEIINVGETAVSVTCNGVSRVGKGEIVYVALSATVDPMGSEALVWEKSAKGIDGVGEVTAVSCVLPPNTGIGDVVTYGNRFLLSN